MPQATIITTPRAWKLLTDEPINGAVRVQNLSSSIPVYLTVTSADDVPEALNGSGGGSVKIPADVILSGPAYTIAALFPSVVAPQKLWVWAAYEAPVSISYTSST